MDAGSEFRRGKFCADAERFSLHAGVCIPAYARERLQNPRSGSLPLRNPYLDGRHVDRAAATPDWRAQRVPGAQRGPFTPEAVLLLDDVLRRMHDYHQKKRSMLRQLSIPSLDADVA